MNQKEIQKRYVIDTLCKKDILQHFEGSPQFQYKHIQQCVSEMTAKEMQGFANIMSERYSNGQFESDLGSIFIAKYFSKWQNNQVEKRIMDDKQKGERSDANQ